MAVWLTTADRTSRLQPQASLHWKRARATTPAIVIDDNETFQTIDGFGHTLTDGTAQLMMTMSPSARSALLRGCSETDQMMVTPAILRVIVGASDRNDHVYTYDDQLGRLGKPDEVAAAALFLASDDSSFTTGSELYVDGGAAQV